jgi:polar amino acid transport system permease protein
MTMLSRLRPSNMVILAAFPFVVYLFTMVPNYRRSFISIVGIERGAGALLEDFLILMVVLLLGMVWPVLRRRRLTAGYVGRNLALGAVVANVALAFVLAAYGDVSALVSSIVANAVDPQLSDLVIKAVTPRQLTPEAMAMVAVQTHKALWIYAIMTAVLALGGLLELGTGVAPRLTLWTGRAVALLNGVAIIYLLLVAHLGFAAGLFTTLRAGTFAYILAACLGLVWAGLLHLKPGQRTIRIWAGFCVAAFVLGTILWVQPHSTYVLAGSLDKRVAIVKGTPKSLVDTVRFGQFTDETLPEIGLRSTVTDDQALALMADGAQVSAVLVPADMVPQGTPEIWRVSFLPDKYRVPAMFLFVGGVLLSLLTFSAAQHQRHPLSVTAEFFIDTVRGIPMLVIILFVGLPFAGALKDVSGGTIDMPNVLRGVIAIAIGYSAYLAEIFRAGIEAVPQGQVEAARSIGLNNWKVARLVVLPQALTIVIPALGNEFIAILKDTSLLSILSVRDVTQRMREFQSASFLPFAPFNSAAILYVFLTLAAASLIASIERRNDVKNR